MMTRTMMKMRVAATASKLDQKTLIALFNLIDHESSLFAFWQRRQPDTRKYIAMKECIIVP